MSSYPSSSRKRRAIWRRYGQPAAALLLLATAAFFLVRLFQRVNMTEIALGLRSLSKPRLALAAAATAGSYGLLSVYDYLGIRHQSAPLSYAKTLATSFVVYAFNFNLGSLIGAVGMRYRLYTRWGLSPTAVGRITVSSAVISWTGFCLVAGLWLTATNPAVPAGFGRLDTALLPVGLLALALVALYLTGCARAKRPLKLLAWTLEVPAPAAAALHLGVACAQWMLVGLSLWLMFPASLGLPFGEVMIVYLVAAIAGLVVHVPAGLGVLEGVFVVWLADRIPKETVLTALIGFRAVYYLIPLALAAPTLGAIELATRARGARLSHA